MQTFIYLMKRNKKAMKIVAILSGTCSTQRLSDVSVLSLPKELEKEITEVLYENRMQWEAWVESAESLADLIQSLSKRGFANFPVKYNPLVNNTAKIDPVVTKRLAL